MLIKVPVPSCGEVVIKGTLNESNNVVYISEFFGSPLAPKHLQSIVNCSISLPGYGDAILDSKCLGSLLTWKQYGNCLAIALKELNQPFTLIGNSQGAMVSIYCANMAPHLVQQLILYRIPTFLYLRTWLKEVYLNISKSINSEIDFREFIETIRPSTSPEIIKNLQYYGWIKSKKFYEGASFSDLDPIVLNSLYQPVFLLERDNLYDRIHPQEAFNLLYSLLPKQSRKKINNIQSLFPQTHGNREIP